MSPREKHIPATAKRTSVCLTLEEKAAIRWIADVRSLRGNRRTTINDILVDSLWFYLEKTEGKTKEQIRTTVPEVPVGVVPQTKIREMPKPRNRR
jgi:hypothetical protein